MIKLENTLNQLKALREEVGTSVFDAAIKALNRQRLDSDISKREKRKSFSWSVYQRHYKKQRGICSWCDKPMVLMRGEIELDHINPNAENFNSDTNLQVLHKSCNREKSSMSIAEQSKVKGTTYVEILDNEI